MVTALQALEAVKHERQTAMTFDPTKPVKLRNGYPARIIATDLNDVPDRPGTHGPRPIVAVHIDPDDGSEEVWIHQTNGCFRADGTECPLDLVNIEPTP